MKNKERNKGNNPQNNRGSNQRLKKTNPQRNNNRLTVRKRRPNQNNKLRKRRKLRNPHKIKPLRKGEIESTLMLFINNLILYFWTLNPILKSLRGEAMFRDYLDYRIYLYL